MTEPFVASGRRRLLLALVLLLITALYLVQAVHYARVLVPVHDGVQYLMVGAMAVRGELGVYDDRLVGNRLPLPFYVLGLTQILAGGPSLYAARALNVAFGALILLLTAGLARRLAGDGAAILAALFLATQGVVVAYYSYESYPAFASFCLIGALYVFVADASPARRVIGLGLIGLLFFVRSNLWPVVPFMLAYALWSARTKSMRALLVAVVAVPPLVFLAWNSAHLKILAYVPVLRRLVAPLGYVSALTLDDRQALALGSQLYEVLRVVRRYEFWALAGALLIGVGCWRRLAGRPTGFPHGWAGAQVRMLTALLAASVGALFVMYYWNFHWVGLYFLPYAPLTALLLGVGWAGLLRTARPEGWPRRLLLVALVGVLLPPLYFARNPLLPTGDLAKKDPVGSAYAAAAHIRALVPPHARVFFYGLNEIYYLSGRPITYLQQMYIPYQFVRVPTEDWIVRRSGFVTATQMRDWLSSGADYAVIDSTFVEAMRPQFVAEEREMLALLDRYFEPIGSVTEFPLRSLIVYRRKGAPAGSQAPS